MVKRNGIFLAGAAALVLVTNAMAQEAPLGSISDMSKAEARALAGLKGKITGKIVWSTSRVSRLVPALFSRRQNRPLCPEQIRMGGRKRRRNV